jgi:hypothetical protein
MAYFIFLKSLRSLEELRKNPHVKIPPKSPSANFQSLDIFKNQILFGKEFFSRHFRPSLFFSNREIFPPLPHWSSASRPAQPTRMAQPAVVFFLPHRTQTRRRRRPASCRLHGLPDASTGREKRPHLIPLHFPPLIGAIPPLFNPENRSLQPRH